MPKAHKPTRTEEGKLKRQGHRIIAGADEAGVGAWAGPLVAAAVVLPDEFDEDGIRDSKQLSPQQREFAFVRISKEATAWAVHTVEVPEIDRDGVGRANRKALTNAVRRLEVKPDAALVDALRIDLEIPVKAIIRGDQKEVAIAAASIMAKVIRDRLMETLASEHPEYGFDVHKGYGTLRHSKVLAELGPSVQHRRSYAPVISILAGQKHRDRPRRSRTAPKGGGRRH